MVFCPRCTSPHNGFKYVQVNFLAYSIPAMLDVWLVMFLRLLSICSTVLPPLNSSDVVQNPGISVPMWSGSRNSSRCEVDLWLSP